MGRKKCPLRIKVNKDTITISFNSAGWNPVHGKLLEFAGGNSGMPIAEYIGNAIHFYARSRTSSVTSFDNLMEMLAIEVLQDERYAAGEEHVRPPRSLWPS